LQLIQILTRSVAFYCSFGLTNRGESYRTYIENVFSVRLSSIQSYLTPLSGN